jgi:hypothetical protein
VVLGLALSARLACAGETLPAPQTGAQAMQPQTLSVLRFDPPTLDLGDMLAGQPRTAILEVTNAGDQPVTVASMKGGCGCTTLGAHPSDPIAPGGSFSVAVTVDPGMRTGIALRKPVHVKLADGRVETMYVVGRVKTIIAVTPDQIEAVGSVAGATARVTLESVDGEPFAVDGSTPAGLLASKRPDGAASRFEVEFDLEAWERAGRPPSIMLSTDRADARQLAVPVKFADAVAMFRLPAAAFGSTQEESRQDALLHAIDAKIPEGDRSAQFRMRLHRESGMLFVHGTASDLETVRSAVRSLPAASGVRESSPSPKG